jgi:ribosomal protein S18 acetylase RimI-like enzyme
MTPTIALRPATAQDEAFLFDLYARNRQAELYAWGLDETTLASFLQMQFAAQQGAYTTQFPEADHDLVLVDQEPVGRIYVQRAADHLLLVDIALLPEMQGQGVGTWLLRALLEEGVAKNVPVRLQVVVTNPAQRLYERLGFAALGNDGVYEQMRWEPPE